MKQFARFFWIPLVCFLMAGKSPEVHRIEAMPAPSAAHSDTAGPVSATAGDSPIHSEAIPQEPGTASARWSKSVDLLSENGAGSVPRVTTAAPPTALGVGMLIAALMGLGYVMKRRQNRKRRNRRTGDAEPGEKKALALAFTVGILVAIGGLFLTMLILGIPAASFGLVFLAYLCTLLAAAGLALVGGLILMAVLEAKNSGHHGLRQHVSDGCGAILTLFLVVPILLAVGTLFMLLFTSLFLGISMGFGIALATWLIILATSVGGIALGALIYHRMWADK